MNRLSWSRDRRNCWDACQFNFGDYIMAKYEITAEARDDKGTSASRRLRRAGKIPAIIYGADKIPASLLLDHNSFYRNLKDERFHTSILTVNIGAEKQQAILRDVQMHPYQPLVMHVDLQRISASEKIHMRVPLHFINESSSPGVKVDGGIVNHLMMEVDVTCLPADLPEFLTVDMLEMKLHQSVHLSQIPIPTGVTITQLAHGGADHAVATVLPVQLVAEVEEAAPAAEAAAAAAAAAATAEAGKAAEGGKAEAGKPEAGKKDAGKKEPAKKEPAKK
jgi:large subunit ribosomal protein L25